jgi:hypothetical protein
MEHDLYIELLKLETSGSTNPADYVPLFIQFNNLIPTNSIEVRLVKSPTIYKAFGEFIAKYNIHEFDPKRVGFRFGHHLKSILYDTNKIYFAINSKNLLEFK